jgi:hypothetical protein
MESKIITDSNVALIHLVGNYIERLEQIIVSFLPPSDRLRGTENVPFLFKNKFLVLSVLTSEYFKA